MLHVLPSLNQYAIASTTDSYNNRQQSEKGGGGGSLRGCTSTGGGPGGATASYWLRDATRKYCKRNYCTNNNNMNEDENRSVESGVPDEEDSTKSVRSLSECYFAGKGAALMLGSNEKLRAVTSCSINAPPSRSQTPLNLMLEAQERQEASSGYAQSFSPIGTFKSYSSDIQLHLQLMFSLLRPEETLKMAVKLESLRAGRTRYLVVVSRPVKRRLSIASSTASSASATPSPNHMAVPDSHRALPRSPVGFRHVHPATTTGPQSSFGFDPAPNCDKSVESLPPSDAPTSSNCAGKSGGSCSLNNNINENNVSNKSSVNSNSNDSINNNNTCKNSSGTSGNVHVDNSNLVTATTTVTATNLLGNSNKVNVSEGMEQEGDFVEVEESCLLGIDCNEKTTVGLVLKVLNDTSIRLDGDGGFSVSICGRTHIFKPVSVQAMWSALQTLHKVSSKAREYNFFAGGPSHTWVSFYEDHIDSDRSCLNEWHAMDSIESRRPPSPDSVRSKPTKKEETEFVIRAALKEIIMSVDLDEVTSKYIRGRLEKQLDMDLGEYKSFIDQEMLVILGQMDAPTEIFDHVFLGSEWNASNLEELQRNGVGHILNVTREIDNFFPGIFTYFNVRVYDDEQTDLLKHWDNTFKYISRARNEKSKVLVHCKMGISRSASVVIAYAMKAYNWDFDTALRHVKDKRSCIKPNKNFLAQLEMYQGMLDAMKNKEKLQRSKSETNLKSTKDARLLPGSEPTPLIQAMMGATRRGGEKKTAGEKADKIRKRPRSWSPETRKAPCTRGLLTKPHSLSLEHLLDATRSVTCSVVNKTAAVLNNGLATYCVSQNQIMCVQEQKSVPSCVKSIVSELESSKKTASTQDLTSVSSVSRHSSFGSGDKTKSPTRNSSWGSYDGRNFSRQQSEPTPKPPDETTSAIATSQSGVFPFGRDPEVPWLPGTVKRTKAKIEERQATTKRPCSDGSEAKMRRKSHNRCASEEILAPRSTNLQSNNYCRLSASAPENNFLTTPRLKAFACVEEAEETQTKKGPKVAKGQGMVKNLKMNFEAKVAKENSSGGGKKGRSLPSSPVHTDPNQNRDPNRQEEEEELAPVSAKEDDILEDINVRHLVDKYEAPTITYRNSFPSSRRSNEARRNARPHSVLVEPGGRPPIQPAIATMTTSNTYCLKKNTLGGVVAPPNFLNITNNNNNNNNSSSTNAVSRKFLQHGKTHPLTRLSDISKQKQLSNAAAATTASPAAAAASYNTM